MADIRDAVIEALADSEAKLFRQLVSATSDCEAYRLVARQAIHYCHAQHLELIRLRAAYQRLRALRKTVLPLAREVA